MSALTKKFIASLTDTMEMLASPLRPAAAELNYPEEAVIAISVCSALGLLGVPAQVVAGSARWLVMSLSEQGDSMLEGKKPIGYFGYDFDFVASLPSMLKLEFPPTMHLWVEDHEGRIYDFTTAMQMASFEEATGREWPEKRKLPEYIAGMPDDLKVAGWEYIPEPKAGLMMVNMLQRLMLTSLKQKLS